MFVRGSVTRLAEAGNELDARIALCRAEIARCEARKAFAAQHRLSAEALFRKS